MNSSTTEKNAAFEESSDLRAKIEARASAIESASPACGQNAAGEKAKLSTTYVLECLRRNRVGDASLWCTLHEGKYIFVQEWEKWLVWTGQHWEVDIRNQQALADVERVCAEYQAAITEQGDDESPLIKTALQRMNTLRSAGGRKEVLECASTIDNPPVISAGSLDQQPYLLATPTGVVDLRTGECSSGRQEQLILNPCCTPWTGIDTPCPNFMAYLKSCMDDDQDMVDFILRLLGYGLLGDKYLNIWAIMYGPLSRNGKDTLMNIIKRILGRRLHVRVNVNMLVEQKFSRSASQPEPDLMALRGARIAYASEASPRQTLDQMKIKDLTGGGWITARNLSDKDMTEWKPSTLLMLLTNYLPKLDFDDDGFRARTLFIEWPVKFVANPTKPYERKIDYDMARKLEAEDSGILAAMVRGCMDVVANGLRVPEKVVEFSRNQIDSFDDVGRFLRECCDIEETPTAGRKWETSITVTEFLKVLNWWCRKNLGNMYPYTPKKITPLMEKKGMPSKKNSVMYYLGVDIKDDVLAEYETDLAEDESRKGGKRA